MGDPNRSKMTAEATEVPPGEEQMKDEISDPRLRPHIGAQKWDYGDVQEWLSHLNLETYKDKFIEYGIDGPILCEMKKEDWELLGIHNKKHLQKITNSMSKLKACKTKDDATYWTPTRLQPKLSQDEENALHLDLDNWASEIHQADRELMREATAAAAKEENEGLPPVRGTADSKAQPVKHKPVVQEVA